MKQLDIFNDYPNTPGYQNESTSKEAASEIAGISCELRSLSLAVVTKQPSTADEVAGILGRSILAIRPRLTELAEMGMVEDSGERRKNASGRSAIVWKVAR